jgi:hypothetical protein
MRMKRMLAAWLATLLALSLPMAASAEETFSPQVVHFSPQGTVKRVRQVSARFSEPMVPLGDPRDTTDPFEIDCEEAGTARWVDSRNWVYDFGRDLPAGIRCTFRLRAGLTSVAGKAIGGQQTFRFSTGGPAVRSSVPYAGNRAIEEDQAFLLRLDAEATDASILQHVSFSIEGIPERVGVRMLTGKARDSIVETVYPSLRKGPLVVLQARQSFPNGAKIALHWGKGVATGSGVASEQGQVLRYKVRKAFTARFWCRRERKDAHCTPLAAMTLSFTAPIQWERARLITLEGPGGKRWSPKAPERGVSIVNAVDFKGPFPESTSFKLILPENIVDEAGRRLSNADKFPLDVKTEAYPPLAKFSSRFSIVESETEPALPVTLRNVERELTARSFQPGSAKETRSEEVYRQLLWHLTGKVWRITPERIEEMLPWLRKVTRATREESIFSEYGPEVTLKAFNVPKPNGAKAFEVVGIPLPGPGLYILEIESPRLGAALLGKKRSMYVPAAALVTNLSVHFKWAHANSLVWVTTLDTGQPVPAAWISVHDCRGRLLWSGRTDRKGIARTDELPERGSLPRCPEPAFRTNNGIHYRDYEQTPALRNLDEGLFVTARKKDDLTFVHSSWDDGIEPWRFQIPSQLYEGPPIAHTVFDRSLFRAGETVHMKHVLRTQTIEGFAQTPLKDLPAKILIRHLGSDETYKLSLDWDKAGIAENEWKIPKSAKLGLYQVILERPPVRELIHRLGQAGRWLSSRRDWGQRWRSGEFRVEEFRVPLMKASIHLPAEPQVAVSSVPVDVSVRYLAGGGAGKLPVVLRSQISARRAPAFEEFEGFTFGNGAIEEGIKRRGTYDEDEEAEAGGRPAIHQRSEMVLDATGTGKASVTELPESDQPLELLTELEFRDPNGEIQTVAARIPLWPAKRLVGIKPDSWMASRKNLKARVAVVDVSGKPVEDVPVQVEILEQRTYSNRKRLVGGFYAYEHVEETVRKGILCEGSTNGKGLIFCEGKPPVGGNLVLQASLTDEDGHTVAAHEEVWVASSEDWWFRVQDSDRIDLLPEKKRYEPGETARFQVRMPFRKATALVTTEREGILDARVVELSGNEPVVQVRVKKQYAPNMFVSVLAVRGRAGDVQPTAMVDLGRPAFKLGIAEIRVGWQAHELKVRVTPDRDVYQVREKVKVKISVRTADGSRPPPGSEVALAAVDEGLLELRPNTSWKLLEAMMGRRSHAVRTASGTTAARRCRAAAGAAGRARGNSSTPSSSGRGEFRSRAAKHRSKCPSTIPSRASGSWPSPTGQQASSERARRRSARRRI